MENQTNHDAELQQYYNCIIRVEYFKKHLDRNDELYCFKRIENRAKKKNKDLLKHDVLSIRKDWLILFNNRLAELMVMTVSSFRDVIEWKEQQTDLKPNNLEAKITRYTHRLKQIITGIKMNYQNDLYLALRMQKYCNVEFDLMLGYLKENLLIKIEDAPSFHLFQSLIDDFKNAIDTEEAKFLIENKKKDEVSIDFGNQSLNKSNKPKVFDYVKIGVLFAEGKLSGANGKYYYKNKTFDRKTALIELQNDLELKSIRQYVDATIGADNETTYRNDLFRNETKIKEIVKYCKISNIKITEKYQSFYDNLE